MTISVKHKFECGVPDGADATVVRPSNWNDEHDVSGLALADHDHDGTYEPADATILKAADIGVSVAAASHTHDYLTQAQVLARTLGA